MCCLRGDSLFKSGQEWLSDWSILNPDVAQKLFSLFVFPLLSLVSSNRSSLRFQVSPFLQHSQFVNAVLPNRYILHHQCNSDSTHPPQRPCSQHHCQLLMQVIVSNLEHPSTFTFDSSSGRGWQKSDRQHFMQFFDSKCCLGRE